MPIASPSTVLVGLGALTGLLALPLLLGWVPPNGVYGIRVPEAYASESNWYAINAYGARRFLVFSALVGGMGLILKAFPNAPFWLPIAGLFATLGLLLMTVQAIRRHAASLPSCRP